MAKSIDRTEPAASVQNAWLLSMDSSRNAADDLEGIVRKAEVQRRGAIKYVLKCNQ